MKIYKGNNGFKIIIDCGINMTSATNRYIHAKKPSGNTVSWPASVEGTTGLSYTVQTGDLDEAGEWVLQPAATIGSWQGRGDSVPLMVHEHFE